MKGNTVNPLSYAEIETLIEVTWRFEGFHQWPDAPATVAFLRDKHRHLFLCRARLSVKHDNREVEFFDLKARCQAITKGYEEAGAGSCEMMARGVVKALSALYPGRYIQAKVSEDGENSAIVAAWAPYKEGDKGQ